MATSLWLFSRLGQGRKRRHLHAGPSKTGCVEQQENLWVDRNSFGAIDGAFIQGKDSSTYSARIFATLLLWFRLCYGLSCDFGQVP